MATDRPLITPHRSTSPPCNFHSSSAAAFDNRFRDVLALFSIARRGREIHRVWKNRHEEISQVFATCEKTEWNQLMEEYIRNGLHTRGLKGSAFEAPRIWLQLRHTSPTIFLPSLPPSILFANLSIYIYHPLANCSNLPSTVKMKTSRVRVHRNSVYYRNSRIASWRANEQSIVPPFPDENSRWSKNFAKQGQPEGGDVARKHRYRTKKQVFDSGQEGKNKGKRDDGEWTFHFSLPSDPKFHISVEQKRLIRWEGRNGIWWCFKRGSLEGLKRWREGGGSFANVRWREVVQVHGWRRALAARIFDGLPALLNFTPFE